MSDSTTLEKVLEGAAALGALLAGALVGRATTAKRDVESDRAVTVLPPPPITLSNADLDALRSRVLVLEGQNADQGRRISALEAADQAERRAVMEAEARRAMTTAANKMTEALNRASGSKPTREAPRDPRRDSDG